MSFIFMAFEFYTSSLIPVKEGISLSYINFYLVPGLSSFMFNSDFTPYTFTLYFSGDSIYREGIVLYRMERRGKVFTMSAGSGFSYLKIGDERRLYPCIEVQQRVRWRSFDFGATFFSPALKGNGVLNGFLLMDFKDYGLELQGKVYTSTGSYTFLTLFYFKPMREGGLGLGYSYPQGYIVGRIFFSSGRISLEYRVFYNEITGRGDILYLSFYLL